MTLFVVKLASLWTWLTTRLLSETTLYVVKRVLQALLTLLLASALSFFIIELAPGNFFGSISPESSVLGGDPQAFESPIWP